MRMFIEQLLHYLNPIMQLKPEDDSLSEACVLGIELSTLHSDVKLHPFPTWLFRAGLFGTAPSVSVLALLSCIWGDLPTMFTTVG